MSGFKSGVVRVVPSAAARPIVEVLFWSGEAGKFVSRVYAIESGGFAAGVAFDLPFKAFGGIAFVKVVGGIASGDTVTILVAGAQRDVPESDVLLHFADIDFTNGNDDRYFWDPINKVLHGPFGANEIAWGWIGGRKFANFYEACVETTGKTETFSAWTTIGGASVTTDQIAAPDSAKLADKLTFGAAAGDGIKIALGSATDNTNQTEAVWFKTLSGTKQFRLQFLLKDSTTATSGDLTATTEWQRFDFTGDILAGGTTPEARIINDSGGNAGDVYIWGASVYKDKSYPWPYRTNETGADQAQAKDDAYWAQADVPAVIFAGQFRHQLITPWDENNIPSGYIYRRNTAPGERYSLHTGGNFRYYDAITGWVGGNVITWTPETSILSTKWDGVNGVIGVEGADSGNGDKTGLSSWSTIPDDFWWGMREDGAGQINGRLTEPYLL